MSADKYLSIFSRQMEAIVDIHLYNPPFFRGGGRVGGLLFWCGE